MLSGFGGHHSEHVPSFICLTRAKRSSAAAGPFSAGGCKEESTLPPLGTRYPPVIVLFKDSSRQRVKQFVPLVTRDAASRRGGVTQPGLKQCHPPEVPPLPSPSRLRASGAEPALGGEEKLHNPWVRTGERQSTEK